MPIFRGRRTTRRVALTAAASLCLGSMPALLAAGSVSAQAGGSADNWGRGVLSPVTVSLPAPVQQIGSSNSDYYALLTNGTVYAWGYGAHGGLGDGNTKNSSTPVQVQFPAGVKIASIPTDADPWDTGYAIDTNGNAWGWGANAGGEFCLGNVQNYLTPTEITPFTNVTALAGAAQHETYDANGTLYSCGVNQDGQLGDGSTKLSRKPVKVQGLSGAGVTAIVSGFNNVGVLFANGQYYDWGWNSKGQLGDGTTGGQSDVPVQVQLPAAGTQAIEGGNGPNDGQTLVMLSNGDIYVWGANGAGQLGTGNFKSQPSPVEITPPSGVTYAALASGGDASYAVSTTGDVYGWGANNAGQLGTGNTTNSPTPVKVVSNAAPLISSTSNDVAVALQN